MPTGHLQAQCDPLWRGRDLAAERVRRGLLQRDIAARLGVSRRRIGAIETAWRPSAAAVQRYLGALER
ncbi:MAG: helix-turn-helix domain-containing protein [Candidatus Limnocylindrales bacterium]